MKLILVQCSTNVKIRKKLEALESMVYTVFTSNLQKKFFIYCLNEIIIHNFFYKLFLACAFSTIYPKYNKPATQAVSRFATVLVKRALKPTFIRSIFLVGARAPIAPIPIPTT